MAAIDADLTVLAERGLISGAEADRYRTNRLVRNYARARRSQPPASEPDLGAYLFARACLDLLADQVARITGPAGHGGATAVPPAVARDLVQRLTDALRPDVFHLREALVWATERETWGLMERFAQRAWCGLLDDLVANASEISATLTLDLTFKLDEYDLAGVPLYVIVDAVQRQGREALRLLGYRQTATAYEVLPPDELGRLYLEPLRLYLGVSEGELVCYDEAGVALGDYTAVDAARAAAEARAVEVEARLRAAEAELARLRGERAPE
nr:hypothetical protein [Chloroflexales bacterium]